LFCPSGTHFGGNQFVIVELNLSGNVRKVGLSYHEKMDWYRPFEMKWEGFHPIVYMAKGSHSLYPKKGVKVYKKLWDF